MYTQNSTKKTINKLIMVLIASILTTSSVLAINIYNVTGQNSLTQYLRNGHNISQGNVQAYGQIFIYDAGTNYNLQSAYIAIDREGTAEANKYLVAQIHETTYSDTGMTSIGLYNACISACGGNPTCENQCDTDEANGLFHWYDYLPNEPAKYIATNTYSASDINGDNNCQSYYQFNFTNATLNSSTKYVITLTFNGTGSSLLNPCTNRTGNVYNDSLTPYKNGSLVFMEDGGSPHIYIAGVNNGDLYDATMILEAEIPSEEITPQLLLNMTFDQKNDTHYLDNSGNNNNLRMNQSGNTMTEVNGIIGKAVNFTDEGFLDKNLSVGTNGEFTYCYANRDPVNGHVPLGEWNAQIQYYGNNELATYIEDAEGDYLYIENIFQANNQWNYYCIVYNGSATTDGLNVYRNGQKMNQSYSESSGTFGTTQWRDPYIGYYIYGTMLDEILYYNYELNETQINQLSQDISPYDITQCGVINQDGLYTLTADINVTPNGADSCLILNASAVSIDCDGHTIEGAYAFLSNAIIDDGALIQRINKPINELEIQDCIINNGKSSGLTYIDGDFSNGYPNASNIYIHNITTRNGISNDMSMYLGAQLLNNVLIQDIKHEGAGFIYLYATHDGSNFTIKDIQFNYPKQDFIIDIECEAYNGGEKCSDITIESIKMPTVNTSTFYPFYVYNMNNVIFKNNYMAENLDPSSVGGITEFSNIDDLYLENNTIETSGTWEFYNTMINTSSRLNKGYFPNETINISEPTNNIKYYDGCYPNGTNSFYYNNNGNETCPAIPCTPNWTCDTFGSCNSSNILPCTGVADLNTCGETFNGTLSDYDDTCTYTTPTGMFVESDLAPSVVDNFTKILVGLASVAILIGMAGAVAIGARTFRGMKK